MSASINNLQDLIKVFTDLIQSITPVVASLALLYFFWGIAQFILHADNETEREKGKNIMIWGLVALFVMVSVWGIVGVLESTFFGG